MKIKTIINLILISIAGLQCSLYEPLYSSTNRLKCTGKIPKNIACLIEASSYEIIISRIDICKNNPFPDFRISPNINNKKCINLYEKSSFNKINLTKYKKFEIPELINNNYEEGIYRYLSIIFENKFRISGEYFTGQKIYKTTSKGPTKLLLTENDNIKPSKFTERLTSWRGLRNIDNKYCNRGGTNSRCELNYNGIKLTAIGLDKNFVETYGNNTKFIFYSSELSPPINIYKGSKGAIDIKLKKNLEVYGNGRVIKSISLAPILFESIYRKN
tara:strand:+ start:1075 stop:1893 length:819 start_codon:yes stop_codon:yes gene_type:complete